jgi:protease-4
MGIVALTLILMMFVLAIVVLTLIFKRETPSLALGDKVGVVELRGVITESQEIIRGIKSLVDDGRVKAIVLRIESPGGGVGASQEIHREVVKARQVKKVVASLGGVAASGGYYVACGSDLIVANPGTITGSIGVVMQFANLEELLEKIGYRGYVIKSGPHKDIGSPFRAMTPDERKLLQEMIDNVQRQFVDAVARGRNLPREAVEAIADGRIFSGEQALTAGLVDQLGNLEDGIEVAARMGGITGKPHVVYVRKKRVSLLDLLMDKMVQRFTDTLEGAHPRLQYLWHR